MVPVMIAVAGGGPCKGVPESWKDSNVIEVDLPTSFNKKPQQQQQQATPSAGDHVVDFQQGKNAGQDFVPATFYFSESGHLVHDLQPNVVVLCYNLIDGLKAVKPALEEYSFEVRAATPRPAICLCAVNAEKLHTVTDIDSNPVSPSEACDLFVRTRAATYAEVSALLGVHLGQVAESITHAALLHAEKRPTPEIIKAMRDHVVAAAFAGSKWVARRDRRTRKIFYFDRERKKAQWERPHDFDGIEPQLTEDEKRQQAAAEVEVGERRARLERERQMNDAYLTDVHLFEERMRSLEKRYEEANENNARYAKDVVDLRRQMGENSELLRRLQHQHDTRVKSRSSFVNSAAERDSLVEKELQAARERMFEIESTLALREEKEEDVHLTELALENRKLAADVRSCLQKQLDTQKTLASNSARCAELSRESELLTVRLMKLKTKQQESHRMLAQGNSELDRLRAILSGLDAEIDTVVNADLYEIGAQSQRQKQLYRAIAHAERALKDARGSIRSRQVVDEHERLLIEQRRLVADLGAAAAGAARWELKVRRALSNFEVIGSDLENVLTDVHASATDLAGYVQAAAASMQLRLDRSHHYARSAAVAASSSPAAANTAGTTVTPLEDKLISLHRAALLVVRESHKDALRRSQKVNEVSSNVANVFDDVLSVPDQTGAPSISETLSAVQRLLVKCNVAIKTSSIVSALNNNITTTRPGNVVNDLQSAIVNSFESHLRKSVVSEQQELQRKKNVRTSSFNRYV